MEETPISLTLAEATERAKLVADCRYLLELDCSSDSDSYRYRMVIEFEGLQKAPTFVDAQVDQVTELLWQGSPLGRESFAGQRIQLPELSEHNRLEISGSSAYHGSALGIHLSRDPADGSRYFHTDLEPAEAHRVFPCFDQPDLKGRYTIRVRVPEGWTVVSAGPGRSLPAEDGCCWWEFEETQPLSAYVLGIVAGPMCSVRRQHGGIEMTLHAPRSLRAELEAAAEDVFDTTARGLDFYGGLFQIPYPFAKYGQVFCFDKVNGAMESPGCVTITDNMLFRGKPSARDRSRRAELILHEMAHMWFGDLVTFRWWGDLWLNESFATFMAAVSEDRATKFQDAWTYWATAFKQMATREDQYSTSHPVVSEVPHVEAVHLNFDRITYDKGAAVLRQLAAWVGEDLFFEAIRQHLREHSWGNADLQQLLSALQRSSGRDVFAWSRLWLETVGVNTLRLALESASGQGGEVIKSATLHQAAAASQPTIRPHRLGLGLYDWEGDRLTLRERLELDLDGETTELPQLVGRPLPAFVLPNDGALTYAKIRLDASSLRVAEESLSSLSDPLARAVVWDSLQDMVRDGELAATRYVRAVIRHLGAETDHALIPVVHGAASHALAQYIEPGRADGLEAELAEVCLARLLDPELEVELRRSWLSAFIRSAVSQGQLERCRGMLAGKELPQGIELDLEIRWQLLGALALRGAAQLPELDQLRQEDGSAGGARRAMAIRGSMPSAQAKEEAFAALVEDPHSTSALAIDVSRRFSGVRQERLLAPFIPRYFEAVRELRQSRPEFSRDFAKYFVHALPPVAELLQSLERALDAGQHDQDLTRIFREAREEAEITIRAREYDLAQGRA